MLDVGQASALPEHSFLVGIQTQSGVTASVPVLVMLRFRLCFSQIELMNALGPVALI